MSPSQPLDILKGLATTANPHSISALARVAIEQHTRIESMFLLSSLSTAAIQAQVTRIESLERHVEHTTVLEDRIDSLASTVVEVLGHLRAIADTILGGTPKPKGPAPYQPPGGNP